MTTELSPQAQAIIDAADEVFSNAGTTRQGLAAALRAAVDQAIPVTESPWGPILVPVPPSQESRDRLLTIATELDGANSTS